MAKFVIDLGDHPLTDDQHHAMASAIHSAVLAQIAEHPATPGKPAMVVSTIDGMMRRPAGTDLTNAHTELKSAVT